MFIILRKLGWSSGLEFHVSSLPLNTLCYLIPLKYVSRLGLILNPREYLAMSNDILFVKTRQIDVMDFFFQTCTQCSPNSKELLAQHAISGKLKNLAIKLWQCKYCHQLQDWLLVWGTGSFFVLLHFQASFSLMYLGKQHKMNDLFGSLVL